MELRDALKSFRSELGLAQADIAKALHISVATVGRWETGKTAPSRSFAIALLHYAKGKSASKECYTNLEQAISGASRNRLLQQKSSLFSVAHSSVSQLIREWFYIRRPANELQHAGRFRLQYISASK